MNPSIINWPLKILIEIFLTEKILSKLNKINELKFCK